MTENNEPQGEPQVEPPSYHGQPERVRDPRDAISEVEDALDDLETLEEGPDTDDD
jgi:hypothetical protein